MGIIHLGSNRELFVDNYLIDNISGSSLKLHEPLPGGVAIKYDQPWETNDKGSGLVKSPHNKMDDPTFIKIIILVNMTLR